MKPLSNGVMNILCKYVLRKPVKMLNKIIKGTIDFKYFEGYLIDRFDLIWTKPKMIDYANAILPLNKKNISELKYVNVKRDLIEMYKNCVSIDNLSKKYYMELTHYRWDLYESIKTMKKFIQEAIEDEINMQRNIEDVFRHTEDMLKNKYASRKLKKIATDLGMGFLDRTKCDYKLTTSIYKDSEIIYDIQYTETLPIKKFKYIDNKELYHRELKQLDKDIYGLF